MCKVSRHRHPESEGSHGKRLLLGKFANTISMATGIPSINETDTTINLDERLARFKPTHYVTLGGIKPEIAATLDKHYGEVRLLGKYDCFNNYILQQPVYLWKLVGDPAKP